MLIRMKKKHRPFNSGEVAGFSDEEALRLIRLGIGEIADEPGPKSEPDVVPEVATPVEYRTAVVDAPETVDMISKRRPGRPSKNRG